VHKNARFLYILLLYEAIDLYYFLSYTLRQRPSGLYTLFNTIIIIIIVYRPNGYTPFIGLYFTFLLHRGRETIFGEINKINNLKKKYIEPLYSINKSLLRPSYNFTSIYCQRLFALDGRENSPR